MSQRSAAGRNASKDASDAEVELADTTAQGFRSSHNSAKSEFSAQRDWKAGSGSQAEVGEEGDDTEDSQSEFQVTLTIPHLPLQSAPSRKPNSDLDETVVFPRHAAANVNGSARDHKELPKFAPRDTQQATQRAHSHLQQPAQAQAQQPAQVQPTQAKQAQPVQAKSQLQSVHSQSSRPQSLQPQLQPVHATHTWAEYDPWALDGGEPAGGSVPLPKRHHSIVAHQTSQADAVSVPQPQQPAQVRRDAPQPRQQQQTQRPQQSQQRVQRPVKVQQDVQRTQQPHRQQSAWGAQQTQSQPQSARPQSAQPQSAYSQSSQPQLQPVHATHTWAEYDPWILDGGEPAGGSVPLPSHHRFFVAHRASQADASVPQPQPLPLPQPQSQQRIQQSAQVRRDAQQPQQSQQRIQRPVKVQQDVQRTQQPQRQQSVWGAQQAQSQSRSAYSQSSRPQSSQPQLQPVHATHTWAEYDPWVLSGGEPAGGSVPLPRPNRVSSFGGHTNRRSPGQGMSGAPRRYSKPNDSFSFHAPKDERSLSWSVSAPSTNRRPAQRVNNSATLPPIPARPHAFGASAVVAAASSKLHARAWDNFQSSGKHKISHRMLWRDTRRSLGKSLGCFISIVCMVALGSFALVGLNVTGPDMRNTADQYFEQHQLADISVISKTGFDDSQIKAIKKASGVTKVEYGFFKDVAVRHRDESMRIFSSTHSISSYALRSGSMPKKANEIAIDAQQAKKHPVGSTVSFMEKPGPNGRTMLKGTKYKVTGVVDSVEIIGSVNRGLSDSGSGSLDGYGVVLPKAFAAYTSYNIARLRYKALDDMPNHISSDYDKKVQQEKDLLADSLDNRDAEVSQTSDSQAAPSTSSVVPASYGNASAAAQTQSESTSVLPTYSIDSRRDVPGGAGYVAYDSISQIIDSLGGLFPIFMYLIAALLTFTSMTRFVDEGRVGAGTLKAFGYSDWDVMKKFIAYGFIAGLTGGIIGAAAGQLGMPRIVYNAYSTGFDVPSSHLRLGVVATVVALILAFAATVLPAYIAASRQLKEKTSALLAPKPPTGGASIALEKVDWFWSKLNFKNKITLRNIFRYKIRTITTIIGVVGALALLVGGVGVQRSVDSINNLQYGNVIQYDLIAGQSNQVTSTQQKQISKELHSNSIKRFTSIRYEQGNMNAGPYRNNQDLTIIAAKNAGAFDGYVDLHERSSKRHLDLDNYGAVISERLAKLNNVKAGDNMTIQDANGHNRVIPISGVCEMYIGHFIFMNSQSYKKIFHQDYVPNANMIGLKNRSSSNAKHEAAKFMALDGITQVSQNSMLVDQTNMLVRSLSLLMQVLIAVSVLLSVVILYNLNNLDISERLRELSTIKVLGYYNREATMYIYRETLGLTAVGVLAGAGVGVWLHERILKQVSTENMMFNPSTTGGQFLFPILLIVVITLILAFYVSARIARIDMLKALQSRE
ncbi:FtsX-like permease family protein [Bifidobacterium sp. ESL0704]|uniref:ABC transporter permease n=1 Tax=Bifidobacterium sp. ESL0704 TaxID=2983219 RepID=UPI0023F9883B|nr:FtsX-like permease family protein [Bifidobacterium sp. ESL0704]WEV53009.1 FtsX-like permease family protein [Bifidobacterium sp. ESL0704]